MDGDNLVIRKMVTAVNLNYPIPRYFFNDVKIFLMNLNIDC